MSSNKDAKQKYISLSFLSFSKKKKQLSSRVSGKGNHVLSHALVEHAREEYFSFLLSGVCVVGGGGGDGGVCKVLKEISRAKQLQYHTEEF